MATITGVIGDVILTGGTIPTLDTDLYVHRWSATVEGDLLPGDTFTNTDNLSRVIRGMYDLKGTFEAQLAREATINLLLFDMLTPNAAPTTVFNLVTTTGKNWTFTGIIGEVVITHSKPEVTTVVVSYESSGAVTIDQ